MVTDPTCLLPIATSQLMPLRRQYFRCFSFLLPTSFRYSYKQLMYISGSFVWISVAGLSISFLWSFLRSYIFLHFNFYFIMSVGPRVSKLSLYTSFNGFCRLTKKKDLKKPKKNYLNIKYIDHYEYIVWFLH